MKRVFRFNNMEISCDAKEIEEFNTALDKYLNKYCCTKSYNIVVSNSSFHKNLSDKELADILDGKVEGIIPGAIIWEKNKIQHVEKCFIGIIK